MSPKQKRTLRRIALSAALFAATLPMTRLAVGPTEAPQLSPWFVTFGRAAVAGLLSLAYLGWQSHRGRLRRPQKAQWPLLAVTAFGVMVNVAVVSPV